MDTDYYFDDNDVENQAVSSDNAAKYDLYDSLSPEEVDRANFVAVFEQTPYPLRLLISALLPVGLAVNVAAICQSCCCGRKHGSRCCSPFGSGTTLAAICNLVTLAGFLTAVALPSE